MSDLESENVLEVLAPEYKENLFKPLVPEAQMVLRQRMLGADSKLAVSVAQDVLDRAGVTKQQEGRPMTLIVITNSQVAMLSKVAQEVEDAIEREGE